MRSNGGRKLGSRVPCPCIDADDTTLSVLHKIRCVCGRGTRPSPRTRKTGHPHCVGDASEIKSLVTRLPLGPPSVNRAHLDRRPTGDGSLDRTGIRQIVQDILLLPRVRTMLCAWSSQYPHRLLTSLFLFQLPNPLLQELPLWFLLGQRQSFLIRGPSLSCPAEPAVHICTG